MMTKYVVASTHVKLNTIPVQLLDVFFRCKILEKKAATVVKVKPTPGEITELYTLLYRKRMFNFVSSCYFVLVQKG